MYKVGKHYDTRFSSKRGFSHLSALFFFFILIAPWNLFSQDDLPIIGVLGLHNGGGVSQPTIDSICNRITRILEESGKYYVLNREFIPIVLREQNFAISDETYTDKSKLTTAGKLLSADEIISGSINRKNGKVALELSRSLLSDNMQLAHKMVYEDNLPKDFFMEIELPRLVDTLLANSSGEQKAIVKKRSRKAGILTTISALAVSGVAAGIYLYLERESGESGSDVPLSGLPIRER